MSDDTRMALGIPRVVTTALGAIEVRTLSAIEFIVLTEQVVGIGKIVRAESRGDGDTFAAIQRVLSEHPTSITGLLSSATKRTAEELGSLPLDEFLDVTMAFIDQHEKSIARFFELKSRWEDLTVKTRPSRNSSTISSPAAGPTPTSEPLASSNSNATGDSPPSELSTTVSSN